MSTTLPITIRAAYGDDSVALRRLAILDSAVQAPAGPLLVAEVEGELHAALSLQTGAVIADPFRPTASLVALLREHAAALAAPTAARSWRPRLRSPLVLGPARPAA
ncbi:MAG TPA: hypothetical protein VLP43_00320 [Solirubrobacteraceae bacterium]|nr:hypothetical protein [Solirubrobacteraceae bacterium]